jgi:hypothetical protein
MTKPSRASHDPNDPKKVTTEPGYQKRLANILKKALNMPPKRNATHRSGAQRKPQK